MNSALNNVRVNDLISFELYETGVFEDTFQKVKVLAFTTARLAANFAGHDVYALHAQVYRHLPEGTVEDNPDGYSYVVIETQDKVLYTIGIPWIRPDSVKRVTSMSVRYTVDGISDADIGLIANAIKLFGYNVKVESSSLTE